MFRALQKWFYAKSLTFRLNISIIICVLLGVLGILLFMSYHSRPVILAHMEAEAMQSMQSVNTYLSDIAWDTQSTVLTMENTLKELRTSDTDMIRKIINSAIKTLDFDSTAALHAWIYVFPDGNVKNGTIYSGMMHDNQLLFETHQVEDFYQPFPWFKAVPKEEKRYWTEPYLDYNHEKPIWVITCLIPFKFADADEFSGLAAVSINLEELQQNIKAVKFKDGRKFLLVSQNGLYIVHPNADVEMKKTIFDLADEYKLPQLDHVGKELALGHGGRITLPYSSVFNSSVITFYMDVPELNWGLCLVFDEKLFFAPLYQFQISIMIGILFFLIILFLLVSWICHRSTKPLLELSKIAEQYGNGNFSAQLPEKRTDDEIGVMTDAFANLRQNLQHHIDLVKQNVTEQQKRLSELSIAQHIQQSALPENFPQNAAFELYASMKAARKIGGDFYDFFFIDKHHFAMVIADVSGKGIPAALYMMTAKALIKTLAKTGISVAEVFTRANHELCQGNNTNMFVTAFLAVLDLRTGVVEYVNAGHNPPLLCTQQVYQILPVKRNLLLGGMEDFQYQSQSVKIPEGGRLFLYTDGVTEAQNTDGEFYGEERLIKTLNQELQSPELTLKMIENDVAEFIAGAEQSDDLTMLEMVYCGNTKDCLTITADVKNISTVLAYIEQDMQQKNLPMAVQTRVVTATEEIFSNIAQYAYDSKGRARIKTALQKNSYTVQFSDFGKPYNPLEKEDPDITLPAEQRDVGGLGIFLVKKMVDKLTYKRQNNQNILTVKVKI